ARERPALCQRAGDGGWGPDCPRVGWTRAQPDDRAGIPADAPPARPGAGAQPELRADARGGGSGMSAVLMPTRILIVGGGGREHALAWKLAGEPGVNEVFVAPGGFAIGNEPRVSCLPEVDPLDPAAVVAAAGAAAAELVVIGPEASLAAGVADACTAAGIPVFGPSRSAARIETSKSFCHAVAAAAGVRMAHSRSFSRLAPARVFAAELAAGGDGLVVKADGLAAGKGVTMCASLREAEAALEAIFGAAVSSGEPGGEAADGSGGSGQNELARVVIEERLFGLEASV